MTVKEFIISRIKLFFFLTVMILIASCAIGSLLAPDQELRYSDLWNPVMIAGLCIIPTLATFSRKKLSLKQMLVRHIIQLVLIEAVILLVTPALSSGRFIDAILIAGATLIIYALAVFLMWLGQVSESKKMTAQLHQLQEKAESETVSEE